MAYGASAITLCWSIGLYRYIFIEI